MESQNSTTEASREIVKRLYVFFAAGDFEGILSCFHQDIEIHEPECLPYGGIYRGIEGALKLFPAIPKYLDSKMLKVDAIVADGDRVVGMLRLATANTGETIMVAEQSIIRDGKIYKIDVFIFDPTPIINAAKS